MIGLPEIAIIVFIALVLFGYRYLPGLGRKAGTGARDLKESVQEMVGDKADPSTIGKSAGKGVREVREFRDALTGKTVAEPEPDREREPAAKATEAPAGERAEPAPAKADPDPDERPA